MTAKEFQIWVQEETDFSVLDVVDYDANNGGYMIDVESIFDIAKAYHKAEVEAKIGLLTNEHYNRLRNSQGDAECRRLLKEQLLKK